MSRLTLAPARTDGEATLFSAPVRSGRRRHDRVGHLEITNVRLRFHGPIDVNIPWNEVEGIEPGERHLTIRTGDRQLRFCFHTLEEANQAALLAASLWSAPEPAA